VLISRVYLLSEASFQYTDNGSTLHCLPPMSGGCMYHPERDMTVLRNGNTFVLSRHNEGCSLYERDKNQWKICPDPFRRFVSASCGAINRRDGIKEVVVTGGEFQ
jgi:hypothetical protein